MINSERGDIERDILIKNDKNSELMKLLTKMKELIAIYKRYIFLGIYLKWSKWEKQNLLASNV